MNEAYCQLEDQFNALAGQAQAIATELQATRTILTNPDLLANYTNEFFTNVVPVDVQGGQPQGQVIPGGPQEAYQQMMDRQYSQAPQQPAGPAPQATYGYPDEGRQFVPGQDMQQQQQVQRPNFPGTPPSSGGPGNVDLSQVPLDKMWMVTSQLPNSYWQGKRIFAE